MSGLLVRWPSWRPPPQFAYQAGGTLTALLLCTRACRLFISNCYITQDANAWNGAALPAAPHVALLSLASAAAAAVLLLLAL